MSLKAVCDIAEGEEILIDYLDLLDAEEDFLSPLSSSSAETSSSVSGMNVNVSATAST